MEALSLYAKLMNEDPVYAMYAKLQSQQYYMQQSASAAQQVKSTLLGFDWHMARIVSSHQTNNSKKMLRWRENSRIMQRDTGRVQALALSVYDSDLML